MIRIHYGYATKWLRFSFTTWSTTPNTVQFHSIATYLHRGPHRETMPAKTRAGKRAGAPEPKSASPHSEEPTEVEANTETMPAKTRASKRAGAPDSKSASPHSETPTEVEANTADSPTDTECNEVDQIENEVDSGEHGDGQTDSASGQKKSKKTK